MKRLPSPSSSSEPSKKKLKFSQSEVQILIEQEVRSVLKKSETKLQGLLETIQQLDRQIDYESSIQKLEARVNMVTQRAEAALAHMARIKTQQQSCGKVDTIADSQDESTETTPQLVENNKSKELSHIMETTKKALKKMHTDKEALTAAIADLSEEQSPSILAPYGTPEFEKVTIKNEHENSSRKENHFETVAEPKVEAVAEPKVDTVKKECCSPDVNKGLKHRDPQQDEPMCPPLPTPPFPSILSMEAALYNIPPKPKVHLALIKNPARLSVLWDVVEKDPSGPPMDNYTVYMTMEKDKGSGVFIKWTTLGVVADRPLPICVMVSKYKPGHKICFAVVGKDKFGRYGPYSDVVTANIP